MDYNGVVRRELEDPMSTISSTRPAHRIALRMSATDRFLLCMDCQLQFEYPLGADYDSIMKQFESHSCTSSDAAVNSREGPSGVELERTAC